MVGAFLSQVRNAAVPKADFSNNTVMFYCMLE